MFSNELLDMNTPVLANQQKYILISSEWTQESRESTLLACLDEDEVYQSHEMAIWEMYIVCLNRTLA